MKHRGLIGIDQVMRNLNKELKKIHRKATKGMIEAMILVRRDMDKTPPLIPVDFGNLRVSWFITAGETTPVKGGEFKGENAGEMGQEHATAVSTSAAEAKSYRFPVVVGGFSASYATEIHELKFEKGKRPGSGPKFFETALNRNRDKMLQIIANSAKI